ncbi:MAG: asparagine synthase-related protein, partial [Chthoniobacterales bacterium]
MRFLAPWRTNRCPVATGCAYSASPPATPRSPGRWSEDPARPNQAQAELRTFSIAFDDPEFDESAVARRTAEHFGAVHTEWRMTA